MSNGIVPTRKFKDDQTVVHDGLRFTVVSAYFNPLSNSNYPGWHYGIDIDIAIAYQRVAEVDLTKIPEFEDGEIVPTRKFEDGETVIHDGIRFTVSSAYYNFPSNSNYPGWYYNIDIAYQRVAEIDLTKISEFEDGEIVPTRKFEDGETVIHDGIRFTVVSAHYNTPSNSYYPGWSYNIDIDTAMAHQRVTEADLTQMPA